jgi:UDP-N-acetylmuramoyl-tripeptide--D-alanyl-D-alanine ligase
MVELRTDEIAEKDRGAIVQGPPSLTFREFNIDSRLTRPGELFFAIVARRNGHDYVSAAAERGAKGAVISQAVHVADDRFALIRVGDTLEALQTLAGRVLAEHPLKVVGITGSVGKTTTKEFTAALLAPHFAVLKSEGNFNNQIGLALTLLRLEKRHQAAVLEMGMSAPGEIKALTGIAPPDVAVITNINPVHLEFLKTMENIASAKKEILDGMKNGGTAVLNGDDLSVRKIAESSKGKIITFGFSEGCDIQARNLKSLGYDGIDFDLKYGREERAIRFPFLTESSVSNLLAALGVAFAFSLPLAKVEKSIRELRPFSNRGILLRLGHRIMMIDDSYNSNPNALATALRNFSRLPAKRKVAVLGDMLELGEATASFHEDAGRQVVLSGWDLLVTVGPLSLHIADGAISSGMQPERIISFRDSAEAAEHITGLLQDGDLVLVKGSRGIRTEKIVEKIKTAFEES